MEAGEHFDRHSLCAGLLPKGIVPRPWTPRGARHLRHLGAPEPPPEPLGDLPADAPLAPSAPAMRPMRSESTPSLDFDRFACFAMTPLPKFNAGNDLGIQR